MFHVPENPCRGLGGDCPPFSGEDMNGRNGQGPAWGLKEQLARRKIDVEEQLSQATAASTGTHDHQDLSRSRPTRSKIRIPFSDDGLVKNIQQVLVLIYFHHGELCLCFGVPAWR